MGRYTIIAEIDEHLRQVLADGLVPELLPDKNAVGLCSPDEKGDLNVGICLYDICENENLRISGMVTVSYTHLTEAVWQYNGFLHPHTLPGNWAAPLVF